jgi:hypothetical protein
MAQSRAYPRYEEDHYGWLQAMIALLKERRMDEVDIDHIVEDLEDMARSDARELISRLAVLIAHLLKWQYQPKRTETNERSWGGTIREQRSKIKRLLKENPGLKPFIPRSLEGAFEDSICIIQKETLISLKILPAQCPWTFDQIMDESFFPGDLD